MKIPATLQADVGDARAKLQELVKKLETRLEARKHRKSGASTGQRAASLLFVAQTLNDDLTKSISSAENLLATAKATPRPATPPQRDSLFQRPAGAPLSEYELQVQAHTDVVGRYEGMKEETRVLKERVVTFRAQVRELREDHVPAKKMGKTEHDIESLGNASGNLQDMVHRLEGLVAEAGAVATERR